ncbi:hypothetical protein V1512DRAFT_27109 [Lipomyces arxii]|uniref:uncharacterized protein n=1 Tax=Lipomyces arxii TaxID=56418 RepID=UPI0034CEEDB7
MCTSYYVVYKSCGHRYFWTTEKCVYVKNDRTCRGTRSRDLKHSRYCDECRSAIADAQISPKPHLSVPQPSSSTMPRHNRQVRAQPLALYTNQHQNGVTYCQSIHPAPSLPQLHSAQISPNCITDNYSYQVPLVTSPLPTPPDSGGLIYTVPAVLQLSDPVRFNPVGSDDSLTMEYFSQPTPQSAHSTDDDALRSPKMARNLIE